MAIALCGVLFAAMWVTGYRISHRKSPVRGHLYQVLRRIERWTRGLFLASIIVMALALIPLGVLHFSGGFLPADYAIVWVFTMTLAMVLICICALLRFFIWAYNRPFMETDQSKGAIC